MLFSLCYFALDSYAQEATDSTSNITADTKTVISRNDSTSRGRTIKKLFQPDAKKSGMYSSILPGLGQAYNRQYWKLPVVYAVLGTAGYFIKFNLDKYNTFRRAYIYSIDGDPSTQSDFEQYTSTDLKTLQDSYRKNLDLTVLLTALGYTVQILDAVASAHLRNFDVSPDISMKLQPVVNPNYIGVGLVMNFK